MSTPPEERAGGFLGPPEPTPEASRLYDEDTAGLGYVMNNTRLWAHQPEAHRRLGDLLDHLTRAAGLTMRLRGVLVTSTAAAMGDSYCSLAWGEKLARETDGALAAAVLRGDLSPLTPAERALADWARRVATAPNDTTAADVQTLRDAGYSDDQVLAITAFVAMRLAFSTVNDALGATPDAELVAGMPAEVADAVTWGRGVAD
jgi:uncharacterized peroxidase-related enzyme